jgi:MscS family membrane protein
MAGRPAGGQGGIDRAFAGRQFGGMIKFWRYFSLAALTLAAGGAVLLAQDEAAVPAEPTTWAQGWAWTKQVLMLQVGDNAFGRVLLSLGVLLLTVLLRRLILSLVFKVLQRIAARTTSRLDDKIFAGLQSPLSVFILVLGVFLSLALLSLDPAVDRVVLWLFQITVMTVIFWGFLRLTDIVADHVYEHARDKGMGITPFIPLIKKTLRVFFIVIGVILIIQNMGYSVGSLLAGLGIGGLAVALAAQDSLSNFFGSLVVAVDRPFKVGDFVQIGSTMGSVEEIGLRSSRLRTPQRTLVTIPNKMMANEVITNFSVMPQRRVDQTIGLTYDTTPDQMEAILGDFRAILKNDPGVHQDFLAVNFLGYGASSLDIQIIYFCADPNIVKSFELRERINLALMRAVNARGLSFAFPTQTVHLDGAVAKQLAARGGPQK